jgi:predicted RNA-binding Zn-ribbon protein involved in translation (DUF1610 family)
MMTRVIVEQITHGRFLGGTIYCSAKRGRLNLGPQHRYGEAFTCPHCGTAVPARRQTHERLFTLSICKHCNGVSAPAPPESCDHDFEYVNLREEDGGDEVRRD